MNIQGILTKEQGDELVRQKGLDPAKFYWNNIQGQILPNPYAPPEPEPEIKPRVDTPAGTFFRTTAAEAIPSAVALPAALAVGSKLTAVSAPFVGPAAPVVGLVGGAVTGIGAHIAAKAAQEGIARTTKAGNKFYDELERGQAENPKAAFGGQLASSLVGGRINPAMLKDAANAVIVAKASPKFLPALGRAATHDPALQQVTIGGAVGTGGSVASDLISGQDVSIPRALASGATGALVSDVRPGMVSLTPKLFRSSVEGAVYKPLAASRLPANIAENVELTTKVPADKQDIQDISDAIKIVDGHIANVEAQKTQNPNADPRPFDKEVVKLLKKKDKLNELLVKANEEVDVVTLEANPEFQQWSRDISAAKGVDKVILDPTGELPAGARYGNFADGPIRVVTASTTANQKGRQSNLPDGVPDVATTLIHEPLHAEFANIKRGQKEISDNLLNTDSEENLVLMATKLLAEDPQHANRDLLSLYKSIDAVKKGIATPEQAAEVLAAKFRYDRGTVAKPTGQVTARPLEPFHYVKDPLKLPDLTAPKIKIVPAQAQQQTSAQPSAQPQAATQPQAQPSAPVPVQTQGSVPQPPVQPQAQTPVQTPVQTPAQAPVQPQAQPVSTVQPQTQQQAPVYNPHTFGSYTSQFDPQYTHPSVANSKPRYKTEQLTFPTQIDKAIYTLTNKGAPSKSHQTIKAWLNGLGIDDTLIASEGARIRAHLKAQEQATGTPQFSTALPPKDSDRYKLGVERNVSELSAKGLDSEYVKEFLTENPDIADVPIHEWSTRDLRNFLKIGRAKAGLLAGNQEEIEKFFADPKLVSNSRASLFAPKQSTEDELLSLREQVEKAVKQSPDFGGVDKEELINSAFDRLTRQSSEHRNVDQAVEASRSALRRASKPIQESSNAKQIVRTEESLPLNQIIKEALEKLRNTDDHNAVIDETVAKLSQAGATEKFKARFRDAAGDFVEEISPKFSTAKESAGIFRSIAPAFDKVRDISEELSEAFHNTAIRRDQLEAKFVHIPLSEISEKFSDLSETQLTKISRALIEAKRNGTPVKLSGKELELATLMSNYYKEARKLANDIGLRVKTDAGDLREGSISDWYYPEMLNSEAIKVFTTSENPATAERFIKLWIKHVVDRSANEPKPVSAADAEKEIRKFVAALGAETASASHFNALRKSAGYGLPKELTDLNPIRTFQRYGKRFAKDLSKFEFLEKPDNIRDMLSLPDQRGVVVHSDRSVANRPEVRDAMTFVNETFQTRRQPKLEAAAKAATNVMLGPATAARDVGTAWVQMTPYASISDIAGGFANISKEAQNAVKAGATHGMSKNEVIFGDDLFINTMRKASDGLRKYQGREAADYVARVWSFATGKLVAEQAIKSGDAAFLKKFGRLAKKADGSWDVDVIAKNFVDRTQGTFDGRGLPLGAVDSQVAPWMSLSRWSLEKSNVIWQDVLQPALTGKDYGPLLKYTLGAFLGGAGAKALTEVINSGKKDHSPDFDELEAADASTEHYVAKYINLLQMGSFAGIAGDMAKIGVDLYQGKSPRGWTIPAVNFLTEGISDSIQNFASGVRGGTDPLDALGAVMLDLVKTQSQAARIALNAYDKDAVDRGNKFRDIRVWREITDRDTSGRVFENNPAEQMIEREFKQSSDPAESKRLLQEILASYKERFANDPKGLAKALQSLKRNSYQTVPKDEPDRSEYLKFLKETQGEEAAIDRIKDKERQDKLNKAKVNTF